MLLRATQHLMKQQGESGQMISEYIIFIGLKYDNSLILEVHLYNCNPLLTCFNYLPLQYIHNFQVEAYRDMINPVVDAFKYLTQVLAVYVMHVLYRCSCPF